MNPFLYNFVVYCARHNRKRFYVFIRHKLSCRTCLAPGSFKKSISGPSPKKVVHHCRRSNCSTPSANSTSALEDMLLRMETRLSKGQQLLAQETSVALDKLSYQLIAQTAESAVVKHPLASLQQSVQNSRHSSLRSSPNLSAGLTFTTGNLLVMYNVYFL